MKIKSLLAAFCVAAGIGTISTVVVGCSDQEGAEKTLKSMGYTVVDYQGKPGVFTRGKNFYADEFRVVPPNSKDTINVMVTKQVTFDKPVRKIYPLN